MQDAVLSAIGIAGILLVSMAAPNALQILGKLGIGSRRFGEQSRSALGRLARRGLIVFEKSKCKTYARITEEGRHVLAFEQQKAMLRDGKKRWDGRYRLVMFDISEKRRKVRVRLREVMRACGLFRLQDSVWIYPYDCEDLIALLKTDLHIGGEVIYAIVEKIENDAKVRNHFGLPVR